MCEVFQHKNKVLTWYSFRNQSPNRAVLKSDNKFSNDKLKS